MTMSGMTRVATELATRLSNKRAAKGAVGFALSLTAVVSMVLSMSNNALAGGFQLSVRAADSSSEVKDAVLLVKTFGCFQPSDANVVGTAEGVVNGQRKTIKLDLHPTSTGVYAVKQQWPSEGKWVLLFSGNLHTFTCSVMVDLGPNGKVEPGTQIEAGSRKGVFAQSIQRTFTASEIDAAFKGSAMAASSDSESSSGRPETGFELMAAGTGAAVSLAGLSILARRRFLRGTSKRSDLEG